MEGSEPLIMLQSLFGFRLFSWWTESRHQPKLGNILKLSLAVTTAGFVAGPPIYLLTNLVAGHSLGVSGSLLPKLVLSASFGALMSFSFFVTCAVPAIYLAVPLKRFPRGIAQPMKILTAFAGGLLGFALPSYLAPIFFGIQTVSPGSLRVLLIVDGLLSVILALLISAFTMLQAEVRKNESLLFESKLQEKMLAEQTATAQLRALQAQINPHFFFNTLNTIGALVNRDSAIAKEMLTDLSAMYRYTLRCTETKLIKLEDDLEFVRGYLAIEGVRFRDRLKFRIEPPDNIEGLMLPGLALQPIVENAIKHGIGRNVGGGDIRIKIERQEQSFTITVCNKTDIKPDLRPEKVFVKGHALKNVRDRLNGIYGSAHEFTINYKGDRVCVKLSLPVSAQDTYD